MSIMDDHVFRGLLFATIGFVFLLTLLLRSLRRLRYIEKVSATVTHVSRRGNDQCVYQPVYEYSAQGRMHKVVSRWGHRTRIVKDGTEVSLYYIPGQPEKIFVPKEERTFFIFIIFAWIFGSVAFVMGICLAIGIVL